MDDLPEEAIEAAEERPAMHGHDGVDEDNLDDHLRTAHGLDSPDHLSSSTLGGVHDRLHEETDAADDPPDG